MLISQYIVGNYAKSAIGQPLLYIAPVTLNASSIVGTHSIGTHYLTVKRNTTFSNQILSDLSIMFSDQEFAEPVIYYYKNGYVDNIRGIFDEAYTEVNVGFDAMSSALRPRLLIYTGETVFTPAQGDWLIVRGKSYNVITSEPDGAGLIDLFLHKR